jgi:hypothetical protein
VCHNVLRPLCRRVWTHGTEGAVDLARAEQALSLRGFGPALAVRCLLPAPPRLLRPEMFVEAQTGVGDVVDER